MDLHVIIVIACVFLASLFSILFINKFFKSKTYEEAAAEKKALVEKLYPSTNNKLYKKQSRKQLLTKKDKKRQQKQQQRETTENDSNDSDDNQSIDTKSIESSSSPVHCFTKKLHVEFTEPEIITETFIDQQQQTQRRSSDTKITSTTAIIGNTKQQQKRNNKITIPKQSNSGILINKNEPIVIKEQLTAIENLNHFDVKHPKDVIELKKGQQRHSDTDIKQQNSNKNIQNQNINTKKSNKNQQPKLLNSIIINGGIDDLLITNDDDDDDIQSTVSIKSLSNIDSPKNSNKSKNNYNSKNNKKDKELLLIMEKINSGIIGSGGGIDGSGSSNNTGSIGVNCIMSLVSSAELNRNDIQILIDYLLNKQQDTITVTHSEWSDDIVQKLRKQLNDKEKQLQEEQDASVGLQAKLRDLRTEINTERAHINVTNKAYLEEILMKKNEIINLNQDIQNLNDKLQIERQQFKLKLLHDKQTSSQELLQQIQQLNDRNNLLQNDVLQKTTIMNELQLLANASQQTITDNNKKYTELNEICKQHIEKILYLEQRLNDTEKQQLNVRQQYDLEMVKIVENEKDSNKVELRNLQNALDSTKAELNLTKTDLLDSKQNINILTKQFNEQQIQFGTMNNQCQENNKTSNDLKNSLADMKQISDDKDNIIAECEMKLKQLITQNDELMKAIKEQKDKNNELRTKNWKLVDALKNAETSTNNKIASATNHKKLNNLVVQSAIPVAVKTDPIKEQQNIRNLLQRLYPNEIKKITDLTIDEFVDYINISENHNLKTTTTTNPTSENYNTNNHNTSHNHNNIKTNKIDINNTTNKKDKINISSNNSNSNHNNTSCSSSSSSSTNNNDAHSLLLQNVQLRTHIDELTKIVTKTENMLINLETQAREQDAHWRNVVQSKQEEINLLKTTNGETKV